MLVAFKGAIGPVRSLKARRERYRWRKAPDWSNWTESGISIRLVVTFTATSLEIVAKVLLAVRLDIQLVRSTSEQARQTIYNVFRHLRLTWPSRAADDTVVSDWKQARSQD